jgi:PAS domain S-box-containing protein
MSYDLELAMHAPSSFPTSPDPAPRQASMKGETQSQAPPPDLRSRNRRLDLLRWLQQNSFAPGFLPEPLRHPLVGYMVAIFLQLAAAGVMLEFVHRFPGFPFVGSLADLGIVLLALGWGAGPSLCATLVGAFLLYSVVLLPAFSWSLTEPADTFGLAVFLVVGLCMSLLASRDAGTRRQLAEKNQQLAQAEARSRADAQRLHVVLDVMPSAVVISNQEGRLLEANPAFRRVWGEQMPLVSDLTQYGTYRGWWAKTGQPVAAEDWALARALTRGEVSLNQEVEIETFAGQRKTILNSAAPLRDETGAITGAVVCPQDISELRRLEREVADAALARAQVSERRFKRLVESGSIGIIVGDTRYVLEANDAYLDMLGYTREEMQSGKLTHEVLSPGRAVLATSERAVREALEKGRCLPFEREYVRKDGSRVPVLIGVALLDREPPLFVSFVVDLTERNRVLAALRASEERLRLLVQNAPASIALLDREMRYLSTSRRWLQEYRVEGDLTGRNHYDVFPEIPDRWKAVHRRCLAGAVEKSDEDQFVRPNGVIQWEKWEIRPWYTESGEIGGIVIFSEDITQQRRLEREREEAKSRELAASAVAHQMDQFFAVAAHDIRTPLTAASGFVKLAYRRAVQLEDAVHAPDCPAAKLSVRLLDALQKAEAATERLTHMTERLFDVARARAGSFTVAPAPCDLAAVVREQVEMLRLTAPTRTMHLRVEGGEPIEVVADADRIGQVVANFVTNALKYSPGDQPIHVRVQRQKHDVRVSVRDHGPGLPPEEQVRVWELCHRAPGVNVQSDLGLQGSSLGLGLHICKRIVELHPRGQVGIACAVGEGSTFWFQLPLASPAEVDALTGTPMQD